MTQYEKIHKNSCKMFEQLGITAIEDLYLRYHISLIWVSQDIYILLIWFCHGLFQSFMLQNFEMETSLPKREQLITCTNVDHDLWYHVASVGHNDLNSSTIPLSSILNVQCSPHSWGKSEHKLQWLYVIKGSSYSPFNALPGSYKLGLMAWYVQKH